MHAIAPQAKIILVEAASNSFANLLAADDAAVKQRATVISNSWGGGEFSGETGYDSHFTAQAPPSCSLPATAVTNPTRPCRPTSSRSAVRRSRTTPRTNWTRELGWSSGGGGVSLYEAQPSYQKVSLTQYKNRATPAVAYNADPYTGVAVYDSYGSNFFNPAWNQYGGTSAVRRSGPP